MADDFKKSEPAEKLRREMVEGLLYAYSRLIDTSKKTFDAASLVYGLIELLSENRLRNRIHLCQAA